MPPKIRITKKDITDAALELVRKNGAGSVNARSIASLLCCSTQPIFSNFSSMEELDEEVVSSAFELYLRFIEKEVQRGEYPVYKSFGMAYIRFAEEEKELFKLLFMCDREGKESEATADFEASVNMLMSSCGVNEETARLMHLEMWIAVHGIATMLATSFLKLDEELISRITSDIYHGLKSRHTETEESDGSDKN